MIVVDTSELLRPTQRKLHAAWWELQGQPVRATIAVARELAAEAALVAEFGGESSAERLLRQEGHRLTPKRESELRQHAWWAAEWRAPDGPYRIVVPTREQEDIVHRILDRFDPRCFPAATTADDILTLPDARIVAESLAVGADLLLTSNLGSIDRVEVNEWAKANGRRLGFPPRDVVYPADATLVEWTRTAEGLDRAIQAGMLACWPAEDAAPAREVIDATRDGVGAMRRGTGGKLVEFADRIRNGIAHHPDPVDLVERTRATFPSSTVESDRRHPTYPGYAAGGSAPSR